MDGVAKTSLLVAAMRALESKRSEAEGRLFTDPYAELLAGAEGLSLLQKALAESGDQPAIAVRTSYMDQRITAAVNGGILQIVILAAGMDARAYRMQFPKGTRLFELDRKTVLDDKAEKLKNVSPSCERKAIPVDLKEAWSTPLDQAGWNRSERTLWVVEGLLMYLDETQVGALFNQINCLASTNDFMLFDVLSRTLLEAPFMQKQLKFLADLDAPWKFGMNEPEEFMKNFGWQAQATQPGDFAPSRWPFPPPPRGIPNLPRSFFVEARKLVGS